MPQKRTRNAQKLKELEGKIQIAISDLKNEKIPSIRRAAAIYQIPYETLRDRVQGSQKQAIANAMKQRLTQMEEDILVHYG